MTEVTHKKTGHKYTVYGTVVNSTNGQEDTIMVLYCRAGVYFVRELSEFLEKFE